MAQPRGRRDPGRGRSRGKSYSSRPARQPARQPAARGGQAGYGGRGNGGPSRGNNGPIIAIIALGGIAVVVLLILVLTNKPKDPGWDVNPGAQTTPKKAEASPRAIPNQPPPRLTDAEKARIRETIDRLAAKEPEARRLKDEGFRAHDAGDRERAQECWHTAQRMLMGMLKESGNLFEAIGDERVELHYKRYYDIEGRWSVLLSDFVKYLE